MLEDLLAAMGRIETLQSQTWGMVIHKKNLAPAKVKPQLGRTENLLKVTNEKGGTVVRFDPALSDADRWALQEVDGKEPDTKAVKAHKQRYTGRGQKMPIEQLPPVGDMVPKGSVALLGGIDEGYQVATFTPHIKLPVIGDIAKRLTGRIWYDVEQQFIERIVVQNEQKLSPVPGLSISELHLGMRFELVGGANETDKGLVVLAESELMVVGKKLFKAFNQISHYQYSDHWLV